MYFFIFYIGACLGSFSFCTLTHIFNHTWSWNQRSRCDSCQHYLHIIDLFPIFSQLSLRFKCRYCQHRLSADYFWIELIYGGYAILLFSLIHHPYLSVVNQVIFFFYFYNLLIMATCDYIARCVPIFLEIGCALLSFYIHYTLKYSLTTILYALCLTLILGLYQHFKSKQIGTADIILITCLSSILPSFLVSWFLFIAAFSGLLWLFLLQKTKHIYLKDFELPFIPFLVLSFSICFIISFSFL